MELEKWLGEENKLGQDIWRNKYCNQDETFDQWLDRVSGGNQDVRKLIEEKKFLFGGRILANRGMDTKGRKVTLSNCYVIEPPGDSIEDIFDCARKLARTYSYGGGCGVDISKLSPRGAHINNAAKETSGAVSFMDLYSMTTSLIGQNGRRGALMISLDCSHPDIEEFIDIKTDLDRVTKANISVRIHDDFMDAVRNGETYTLRFNREATGETIEKEVDARYLFNKLAKNNWDFAEPGALFWDRISGWNLLSESEDFEYAGVNPCAEEPLPAGGSCLLGSLNLSAFVKDAFTDNAFFDYDDFKDAVTKSVKALNEVLDVGQPLHPLDEQKNSVIAWRQIGLGIMGLGDMLIKLGIKYGSKESIEICDQVGATLSDTAIYASALLAKEFGTYPNYNKEDIQKSEYYQYNTSEETKEAVDKWGLRNSQLLTIAPTGTLSTMLEITGGIEPIFANYYMRKTESLHGTDVLYKVYTKIVQDYMDDHDVEDDTELPEYFVTAMNLDYRQRVDMQSVWQTHIDASISSTVNVPEEFTVEQTEDLYLYAHEKGLKGITIFRSGCKRAGILTTDVSGNEEKIPVAGEGLARGQIVQVCDSVVGKKRKLMTGCGSLHCLALFDPNTGALVEAYLSKGSTGGCNNFMVGLSRMISICARGGIDIYTIVDQLNSSGSCPSYAVRRATKKDTSPGACCPMAVGNALLDMYNEVQRELEGKPKVPALVEAEKPVVAPGAKQRLVCPECGEQLVFEGGCNICKNCGWSKCM